MRALTAAALALACVAGADADAAEARPPQATAACVPVCVIAGEVVAGVAFRYGVALLAGAGAAKVGWDLARSDEHYFATHRFRVSRTGLARGLAYRRFGRAWLRSYRSVRGVGRRMREKLGYARFRRRMPDMIYGCTVGAIAAVASKLPDTDARHLGTAAKEGCVAGMVTQALVL
jgi:hypothetical protein